MGTLRHATRNGLAAPTPRNSSGIAAKHSAFCPSTQYAQPRWETTSPREQDTTAHRARPAAPSRAGTIPHPAIHGPIHPPPMGDHQKKSALAYTTREVWCVIGVNAIAKKTQKSS